MPDILSSPQLRARGMVVERDHPAVGRLRLVGNPIQFDGRSETASLPPPTMGQHTGEVIGPSAAAGEDDDR